MKLFVYLSLILTLLLYGCDTTLKSQLDEIESIMDKHPQDALAQLESIDKDGIESQALYAKYSLLKSMAYDKNFIDISSDSIIAPAVSYYSKHGSADEKMMAFFYWGVTFYNSYQYDKALSVYTLAECQMNDALNPAHKGIVYMSLADIYQKHNLHSYAKKYIDKGIRSFEIANDQERLSGAKLAKALHYQHIQKWDVAESIYNELFDEIDSPEVTKILLSNFALVQINKTPPNPEAALKCYQRLYTEYGQKLSLNQMGPYAYTLTLLGMDTTARRIISSYKEGLEQERAPYDYWLYRIARHHGDYYTALKNLEYAETENIQEDIKISNRNIPEILANYYQNESHNRLSIIQSQKRTIYLIISLSIVLVAIITMITRKRRIYLEQAIQQDHEFIQLLLANDKIKTTSVDIIRQQFIQSIKQQFEDTGKLLMKLEKCERKEEIRQMSFHLRSITEKIRKDRRMHEEISRLINDSTNNALDYILSKIHFSERDIQYLYYFIIGLDTRIITSLMNTTPNYVYKTKSSIKKRILELEDPRTTTILEMITP